MKKKFFVSMLAAFVFLVGTSWQCFAAEPVYKLKMQSWRVASEKAMKYYKDMCEKHIPAMTGGRVQIKMYWGGDLAKVSEMLNATKTGIIDIGLASSYYYSGVIPAAAVEYGLPYGFRMPSEVHNFFYGDKLPGTFGGWRAIDILKKEYEKYGVHLLVSGFDCWPNTVMFRTPVKTIDDIKGKKVRVSGLMMNWFQKLGGQGVTIPGEDTYNAIQTGAIDGASWGASMGMWSMRFHEVAKYYLNPSVIPVGSANVIVNKKVWDSMPKDIQAILENAFMKAGVEFTNHQNWTGEQWGLQKMREAKVQVNELKGADYDKALAAALEIWDEVAKRDEASAKLVAMQKDYMKQMGYLK